MFHWLYNKTKKAFFHTNKLNLTNRQVTINRFLLRRHQNFQFKKRLGKGAHGAVYEAIAPDGKRVAIKVTNLRTDHLQTKEAKAAYFNQYVGICIKEFDMLRRLTMGRREKHVVNVYDIGVDSEPKIRPYVYMIMELGNESLEDIIEKLHRQYKSKCGARYSNEYIPARDRQLIWKELIKIVATLRHNGISHMDLKPANIVRFGNKLKVCDLGISKYESGIGGGGTPNFSPPEALIMRGQHHPKVDIWSLGAILYYMTYGRQPSWNPEDRNWEPPYRHLPVPDPLVKDLLKKTLQNNIKNRSDINMLIRHPYTRLP